MRFSFVFAAVLATASGKIQKAENGELIENEWIVVLRPNATKSDRANHISLLGEAEVLHTYDNVFTGYAVRAPEHVMERFSTHADVLYVEQNQVARALQACQVGSPNPPAGLWGLSRVSYRDIQNPAQPVIFANSQGAAVYIMDTGINYNHVDFTGRAQFGFEGNQPPEGPGDGNGHGTHCAGTAAGSLYGISKQSAIWDVKVLGRTGGGTFAGVISGIDWTTGRTGNRVGSLSLGGGFSQATNDAVNRLAATGTAVVSIASGNGNANACNSSPASAAGGITVNSIANNDARSGFSNFGTCTHIFAPGQNVLSAWIGSNTATNTISGTSMACPHVTGIAADMWGRRPGASGAEIRNRVFSIALTDRVTNPGTGSPNRLAQVDCTAA
jgi:subtilisin family serine protease